MIERIEEKETKQKMKQKRRIVTYIAIEPFPNVINLCAQLFRASHRIVHSYALWFIICALFFSFSFFFCSCLSSLLIFLSFCFISFLHSAFSAKQLAQYHRLSILSLPMMISCAYFASICSYVCTFFFFSSSLILVGSFVLRFVQQCAHCVYAFAVFFSLFINFARPNAQIVKDISRDLCASVCKCSVDVCTIEAFFLFFSIFPLLLFALFQRLLFFVAYWKYVFDVLPLILDCIL